MKQADTYETEDLLDRICRLPAVEGALVLLEALGPFLEDLVLEHGFKPLETEENYNATTDQYEVLADLAKQC